MFLKRNLKNKNGKKKKQLIYVPFIEQLQPSTFPYIVEIIGMSFLNTDIYQNILICFTSYVKPVIYDFIKSIFITINTAGHLSLYTLPTLLWGLLYRGIYISLNFSSAKPPISCIYYFYFGALNYREQKKKKMDKYLGYWCIKFYLY